MPRPSARFGPGTSPRHAARLAGGPWPRPHRAAAPCSPTASHRPSSPCSTPMRRVWMAARLGGQAPSRRAFRPLFGTFQLSSQRRHQPQPLPALRASGVRAELVGCQAEKCLLLPGDDINPNKLTMLPVAIECVRHIRREALASFWEACHVAKHNVTKPDHIWFLGFIEALVCAFDAALATDKNRYGGI
jgi:hypothetical protein